MDKVQEQQTTAVTTQRNSSAVADTTVNGGLASLRPTDVIDQVAAVTGLLNAVMVQDQHYGTIPGCGKRPTLLKPGAEKLALMFRLAPTYHVEIVDMAHPSIAGHREYSVVCTLKQISTGDVWASGVGSCSTMESKYRYRTGAKEYTDHPVPAGYWDVRKSDPAAAQKLIGGRGHATGKHPDTGAWVITKQGEKCENDNPADVYNTCLKMAKKRAFVDAVLSATAASDVFTQDVEDIAANRLASEYGTDVTANATVSSEDHGAQAEAQPERHEPGNAAFIKACNALIDSCPNADPHAFVQESCGGRSVGEITDRVEQKRVYRELEAYVKRVNAAPPPDDSDSDAAAIDAMGKHSEDAQYELPWED